MTFRFLVGAILAVIVLECQGQTKTPTMNNANPLLCDPVTGICEIPTGGDFQPVASKERQLKIIYFTDPICSSCWGIEPQLRKLKLEYGSEVEIEYHMGGLLPDWSYNSGGISKPADVAHHWDEVSRYYKMPIDGDIWLTDPLASSYPPSIAFKAAQLQDKTRAVTFLRILREMVFLQQKNITRWEHMEHAGLQAGLDVVQLKTDYEGKAKDLFNEDLMLARKMRVRGFPTIIISNTERVYGFKPYADFEAGIRKVFPQVCKATYANDWKSLFTKYPTLTLREYAELSETTLQQAAQQLTTLVGDNELTVLNTKNGALYLFNSEVR
ncbi:ClpXP adapter SpxH family protein [Chitinophaga sp.]|uniref:ClpXP adapter SpxH family protein n=1 Tax=Chitinophaga sp. TaxID=1869181 RepID=UPI0031D3B655